MTQSTCLSIKELANIFNSTDPRAYRKAIDASGISQELRKTLLNKKNDWRYSKNSKQQEELLEVIKETIRKQEEDLRKSQEICDTIQANLKEARKVLRDAEKLVKKGETELKDAEEHKKTVQEDRQKLMDSLDKQTKRLESMKKFTLVHPTATLTALSKKVDTTIVCTQYDAQTMHFNRFADLVIDTSQDDIVEVPSDAREKFDSIQEYYSALQFVNLVIRYWAEDKPYELLYNSEGISYILEKIM